ncbi:MAG: DinB family protein [Dehalococcoidia bacterium]
MSGRGRDDAPAPAIGDLAASTAEVFDALAGLDAGQLVRRPAPDEWSAWDIAYHVAQIEVWYVAKLCEAASDDAPAAMDRFLDAWRQLRRFGLELTERIPAERLDAVGLLSGVPDWTPRQLIERMAAHDLEHAAQANAATLADVESNDGISKSHRRLGGVDQDRTGD